MPRQRDLSEYKGMWIVAMFDLPTTTQQERHWYGKFRKALQGMGFTMLQYSVYARYCPSEESSDGMRKKIKGVLPPDGEVRLMAVTDRQFGKMEIFYGKKLKPPEKPPNQLSFF